MIARVLIGVTPKKGLRIHKLITPFMMAICFFVAGCFGEPTPFAELEQREGKFYKIGSPKPFTGVSIEEPVIDKKGLLEELSGLEADIYQTSMLPKDIRASFNQNELPISKTDRIVRNFKKGVLDGVYTEFYKNNLLKIHGKYLNGQKIGKFHLFADPTECDDVGRGCYNKPAKPELLEEKYSSYSLIEEAQFRFDKLHGKYSTYYGEGLYNTKVWSLKRGEADFSEGKLNGELTSYCRFPIGERRKKRNWSNRIRVVRIYNEGVFMKEDAYPSCELHMRRSSNSKTLKAIAEDLYDKCQIYGKSYDSRC